jgi:hypothetical protein
MALVNHARRESRLPLTRSLCDFETKVFIRWRASVARPILARAQASSGRVLFQRTATRQQWIVQRLYNDAVNETVELRLLTAF